MIRSSVFVLTAAMGAAYASASSLVSYVSSSAGMTRTDHVPGAVGSDIGIGHLTTQSISNGYYALGGFAGGFNEGSYFEFSIDAAPGYALDLTEVGISFSRSSGSAPSALSIWAFGDAAFGAPMQIHQVQFQNVMDPNNQLVDLTSVESGGNPVSFEGLTHMTFRVYAWGASSGMSTLRMRNGFDGASIIINGEAYAVGVSVPAPQSAVLGFAGLGCLASLRRRRSGR